MSLIQTFLIQQLKKNRPCKILDESKNYCFFVVFYNKDKENYFPFFKYNSCSAVKADASSKSRLYLNKAFSNNKKSCALIGCPLAQLTKTNVKAIRTNKNSVHGDFILFLSLFISVLYEKKFLICMLTLYRPYSLYLNLFTLKYLSKKMFENSYRNNRLIYLPKFYLYLI